MSAQEKVEDSRLLETISQQLNLYDNLFPKVESKELQVLFALIRIYLARCDNPQLKREHMMLNPELMKRLTITYFDPFNTPVSRNLRESLVTRLHSIRKYRIANPEVVRRTLVACLYQEEKKSHTTQKKYLEAFMKHPGKSFVEIASQLSVTPQAVSQAYRSLRESVIKFYGYLNYPMFKLRHFIVFFTLMREYRGNKDYPRRLLFDSLPFGLNLNLDIYEGSSWASFAIPNQRKELDQFRHSLNELRGEVFREINVCELRSFSTDSNLEFFDGKRWFFDPQLWAYGFFEFVRENRELLRKAPELRYSANPIRFDRIDLIIATILMSDPFISHNEIRRRLRQFGYDPSRPTITRRVRRLTSPMRQSDANEEEPDSQVAVYPYATYWGLGLTNLSAYLIECDGRQVEELCYAVSYLPHYFLYRTDKGILLYIKSTAEDSAKINYVMKGVDEINIVAYSNRFENIGGKSLTLLYDHWDEIKQKWICTDDELNFVRRYESLQ